MSSSTKLVWSDESSFIRNLTVIVLPFQASRLWEDEAYVALAYRDKVLAMGGRKDAADLVADFLGRPYSFDSWAAWLAE